ncbi:MAG: ribbon-helix-helix protein, CopG family [Anaerolineae bacterium]
MHRTQLLLNDEQDHRLRHMAIREGKSISEVVRQILDEYFAEQDRKAQMEALEALKGLDRIREATAQYGVYVGDPVNEAREERERQMEDVWHQWS